MYQGYKDLIVYQKSVRLSLEIFELTKTFPKEELYSLTDQIRRSSRSIGANLAEAWPKRLYAKSFIAKLVDSQAEGCETCHWLDIAMSIGYISDLKHLYFMEMTNEILKMLDTMIRQPEKFCKPIKLKQ